MEILLGISEMFFRFVDVPNSWSKLKNFLRISSSKYCRGCTSHPTNTKAQWRAFKVPLTVQRWRALGAESQCAGRPVSGGVGTGENNAVTRCGKECRG